MTNEINNKKISERKEKGSIMELAGTLTEEEGDKMIEEIYKDRKIGSRRFQ